MDYSDNKTIQKVASIYSFNVDSELFYKLEDKELQKLWRKEIEKAVIFGFNYGLRNLV